MIRGVIFDYGSTLITFDGDMREIRPRAHRALVEFLQGEGVTVRQPQFLERFARKIDAADTRRLANYLETTSAELLIDTLREEGFPPQPPERIRRALRAMYAVFEKHWKLYPDTQAALRKIKALKLRMALLSNASDEANVLQMLKNHRLHAVFKPVVISAAIGVRKPDARAFHPILNAWKLKPASLVMVGDQLGMDILGAQELGIRTLWIRSEEDSPTNRPFLGKVLPDAQVRTIGEAAAVIAHWKKK
jgi:HAD superfamily hydrolase (TIGR01549 family)